MGIAVPGVAALHDHQTRWVRQDVVAGIVLAAMLGPDSSLSPMIFAGIVPLADANVTDIDIRDTRRE